MSNPHSIPQAKDFMTRYVHRIAPEMPLDEIIAYLEKHKISNAPVVEDENGRETLVGFVSERDCLAFLANESYFGCPAPSQTAATIMRKHPVCVTPDTELFTLAAIFVNHGFRHLPVVEDGRLVGIVSRRDILKAMNEYYRQSLKEEERRARHVEREDIRRQHFLVSKP